MTSLVVCSLREKVVEDGNHAEVVETLQDLKNDKPALLVAVLDALGNLSLPPTLLRGITEDALGLLESAERATLPVLVSCDCGGLGGLLVVVVVVVVCGVVVMVALWLRLWVCFLLLFMVVVCGVWCCGDGGVVVGAVGAIFVVVVVVGVVFAAVAAVRLSLGWGHRGFTLGICISSLARRLNPVQHR